MNLRPDIAEKILDNIAPWLIIIGIVLLIFYIIGMCYVIITGA